MAKLILFFAFLMYASSNLQLWIIFEALQRLAEQHPMEWSQATQHNENYFNDIQQNDAQQHSTLTVKAELEMRWQILSVTIHCTESCSFLLSWRQQK